MHVGGPQAHRAQSRTRAVGKRKGSRRAGWKKKQTRKKSESRRIGSEGGVRRKKKVIKRTWFNRIE